MFNGSRDITIFMCVWVLEYPESTVKVKELATAILHIGGIVEIRCDVSTEKEFAGFDINNEH